MAVIPGTGQNEWAAEQGSPWVEVNKALRAIAAMARGSVINKTSTAPPGSCADGDCYIVAAAPTGAWAGQAKNVAVAVGTNASNGWLFIPAYEGLQMVNQADNTQYRYHSAAWV